MKKENNTLLEKAKLVKSRTHKHFINEEKLELGIAWAKEEINIAQLIAVLEFKSPNKAYTFLSNCFKAIINNEQSKYIKK
jgi:hypothetical protein